MSAIAIAANRKASGTARPMRPAGATPLSAIAAVGAMIPIERAIASQNLSSRRRCPRETSAPSIAPAAVVMPCPFSRSDRPAAIRQAPLVLPVPGIHPSSMNENRIRFDFVLRDLPGHIDVAFGPNEDPATLG